MTRRAPKPPGSIKHLGGDRYQAVLYIGRDALGRERRLTKVFHAPSSPAAAKASVAVFKGLQERASKASSKRGTVGELVDDWLKAKQSRGASPSTLNGVDAHVDSIRKHLGRLQVNDLTGEHVDAWLEELRTEKVARQRSEATIHHYFATLRTILRWARRKRRALVVATEYADAPQPVAYEAKPPTAEALRLLLDAAGGDFAVALEVLGKTGMRRGELVGLRWTDLNGNRLRIERAIVEVDGNGIAVKPPKSGRPRVISLDDETLQLLHRHHASLGERTPTLSVDAYMFPALQMAKDGSEPHRPTWVNLNWARIKRRTGITFRPHDVRHWHASELLARGVPLAVVSKRLGHTKQTTTLSLYSHVLDDNDDAAAEAAQLALGQLSAR